ncbi:MAG: type II secretion system protein [Planctomycetota bacterium]|nr:type II secretion system protein [Planctomycetota bacterium]
MRRAFTLIEMLVVVSLMALLAGLMLAGVAMMRDRSKRSQTEAIIAQAMAGLALVRAQGGALPQPSEHPLAGSAEVPSLGRPLFVRGSASLMPGPATVLLTAGAVVSTTGTVFSGIQPHQATPPRTALLLGSDRYSGGSAADARASSLPLLYGFERERIGVVGAVGLLGTPAADATTATTATLTTVTAYRIVSAPAGSLQRRLDAQQGYAYTPTLELTSATPARQQCLDYYRRAIAHDLGLGVAQKELGELGALHEADDETTGSLLAQGRVAADGNTSAAWKPGMVADGGQWRGYRLRGLALYDAWGRELLYSVDRDNPVVMSAGLDGVFAVHPGQDGRYQTDPHGSVAGDDRDGRKDNVVTVEVY